MTESQPVKAQFWMVFDIESVGLHGEGFAFAYVVVDDAGNRQAEDCWRTSLSAAKGADSDREWVKKNVVPHLAGVAILDTTRELRDKFWCAWMTWKNRGAYLVADCAWPVETNFLSACIADAPAARRWQGPYPLLDVAPIYTVLGMDPTIITGRKPDELPAHHPLCDARHSARQWIELMHIMCGVKTVRTNEFARGETAPSIMVLEPTQRPDFQSIAREIVGPRLARCSAVAHEAKVRTIKEALERAYEDGQKTHELTCVIDI